MLEKDGRSSHPYDPDTFGDAAFDPEDDVPDLSTAEGIAILTGKTRRGRPKASATKGLTTLRIDRDVLNHFKSQGPGWQSRINAALRKAAGL
jgi:uncharacterized protein (DUF4415 family)